MGSASYAYDGAGNRIQQTVSATVTNYLLDLQPGLATVLQATQGANTTRYVHALRGIHAQKDASGNWEWMLQDGLGSVRSVVDSSLNPLESRLYDPYGVPFGTSGTSQTSYGFTGEMTDANNLLYLRARYYAPSLGVFTGLDPFEGMAQRPMSLNGYSWVEGNVPNRVDPSGFILEQPDQFAPCALSRRFLRKTDFGSCSDPELLPAESFLFPSLLPPSTKQGAGAFNSLSYTRDPALGHEGLATTIAGAMLSVGMRYGALAAIGLAGKPLAGGNLLHYLNGSGMPVIWDVDQMFRDIPDAETEAYKNLTESLIPRINQAIIANINNSECLFFQFTPATPQIGGWNVSKVFGGGANSLGIQQDYYLALGEYHFGLSGGISAHRTNSSISVKLCYLVNIFDRYDWEPGFAATLNLPILGGQHIPNEAPGSLNLIGMARTFDIYGVSSLRCIEYHMPQTQGN